MTYYQINVIKYCYIGFVGLTLFLLFLFVLPTEFVPEIFGLPSYLVLIVLCIFIALPVYFLNWLMQRVRTRNLKLASHGLGWKYNKSLKLPFLKAIANRLKIKSDHPLRSSFSNGMTGKLNGWNFVVFDGEYSVSDAEGNNANYRQTIFALRIKDADFPLFGLEPESIGSKFRNLLGRFNIDFVAGHSRHTCARQPGQTRSQAHRCDGAGQAV